MPELRYHPFLETWTMVATNRQNRPHLPQGACPFCPKDNPALGNFTVLAYPNDFPVLSLKPDAVKLKNTVLQNREAYGQCEVLLYSPDHHKKLYELEDNHVTELISLWQERFNELKKDRKIKYIFPFENKGEEVGVTIHHPHGQLYAYSWIPSKLKTELHAAKRYFRKNGRSLFNDVLKEELKSNKRILRNGTYFTAYIPYFTDYPFGVYIQHKKGKSDISQFNSKEKNELAVFIKQITKAFDKIYDRSFPYMMCVHQAPVNSSAYKDAADYFSFHIEFYPPLRAADKIKWYAGSEMGAGAAANPLDVDACAELLKSKMK